MTLKLLYNSPGSPSRLMGFSVHLDSDKNDSVYYKMNLNNSISVLGNVASECKISRFKNINWGNLVWNKPGVV